MWFRICVSFNWSGYYSKSNRELNIRINEHKIAIRKNDVKSSVGRHKHDVCSFRFIGGEVMEMPPREGDTI